MHANAPDLPEQTSCKAYSYTLALSDQDYTFESKQYLQIIVLDVDDEKNLPTKYVKDAAETDLLGRVECLLSEVVGARNSTFEKDLVGNRPGSKYGRIRVQWAELAESASAGDTLVLHLQGKALAAKDGARRSSRQHVDAFQAARQHTRTSQPQPFAIMNPRIEKGLSTHSRHAPPFQHALASPQA
jgi:hypothetical protein